ncbi:DUF1542 domain-containing protein [Staphylococcus simiae]|uniref:SasC/FmtB family protein n=1 Tax=Staphylococcus simiae TaxID=308354 RepID=UPI001A97661B|nr:SasC/FmtB family protein [Staphylococcus simiae]MBO1199615.1 DUF1542 domain-containing protein [Staphylococcus simiae]MBO1201488.1 DUF1542 domain-containing protein [Staphylococcus simiae]MBO1203636.1 DUF1542 domain-containing protein [Staphylococcus simiae]MBO1211628.1 DUF1542 domain-containing protein [Staphylococcus simiae]MBO1229869.1 DUF1542 domain-containing protein [Staphylococcus simiae]
MNLEKNNKYSIRKYKIGILSTVIGSVLIFANSNHSEAFAAEQTVSNTDTNLVQPTNQQVANQQTASQANTVNNQNNTLNTTSTVNNNINQSSSLVNSNSNKAADANNVVVKQYDTTNTNIKHQPVNDVPKVSKDAMIASHTPLIVPENTSTVDHHISLKEIQEQLKHTNDKTNVVAVTEATSNKPKKRTRRQAPGPAPAAPANNAANTDPGANNVGSINEVFTFDNNGINPSPDKLRPTITVVNNLPGFTMINNGKVGVLSASLVRTSVFNQGDPKNDQASDNVIALGRVLATNPSDTGDFNGIEKIVSVHPNSEVVFQFNTMASADGNGATILVLKNAADDSEIARATVDGGSTLRLATIPANVTDLKIQLLPDASVHGNFRRVTKNQDGYKYFSLVDTIGVKSGSHAYIKNINYNNTIKTDSDLAIDATISNDGNFGASLENGALVYKVKLPDDVTYVDNSLVTSTPIGNVANTDVNPFAEAYDRTTNTVTFSSNGLTAKNGAPNTPMLLPLKDIHLKFKVHVNRINTPKTVNLESNITYKTYTELTMNTPNTPYTTATTSSPLSIIMNKDALQTQYDFIPQQVNYTYASILEYNKLKVKANNILNEQNQNVPVDQRATQQQIDQLVNQMSHTLVSSVNANQQINQKAQQMVNLAENNNDLTDEEKTAIEEQIDNHKNQVLNDIDNQTTDQGVTNATNTGIQLLNGDVGVPVVKPAAKKAVSDKAAEQKQLNNNNSDATTEEITAANQKIDTHVTEGDTAIDNATTNDQVAQAKDAAIANINTDVVEPIVKPAARNDINQLAATKRQQLLNIQAATKEEKDAAIANLDQEVTSIINNINQATTNNQVNQIKTTGLQTIDGIQPVIAKKPDARSAINQAAIAHKAVINQSNDSTIEEKQTAISLVDQAVTQAEQAIDQATTNAEVDQLQQTWTTDINNILPATKEKTDARNEVHDKAQQQIAQIKANNDATDEEQDAAIQEVNNDKTQAVANINNATTNQEVQDAKNNGINDITLDEPQTTVKTDARTAVTTKANDKKQQLTQTPNATQEEIAAAQNQVDQQLQDALNKINNARKTNDVNAIKDSAIQNIDNVTVTVQKKPDAINQIDQKQQQQEQVINNNTVATAEEKQAALQQLTHLVTQIKNNINQATHNNEVELATTEGLTQIAQVLPQEIVKPTAIQAINDKYTDKIANINQTPDATKEEKDEAINALNIDKQQAINAINQATTNAQVEQAKTDGLNTLEGVAANVVKKNEARNTVKQQATTHDADIVQTPDTTVDEQQQAKDKVQAALNNALQQINQSQTNSEVDQAATAGVNTINAIIAQAEVKPAARNAINQANDSQTEVINNNVDATDNEKEAALQRLATAKTQALNSIDQANTNDQVNQLKVNAINDINAIVPETRVKPAARERINQHANEKRSQINQDLEATSEERQAALQQLDNVVKQAMQDINNDKTNQQVNDTETQAFDSIAKITPAHLVRSEARNAVEQKSEQQKERILTTPNATDEEKNKALNDLASLKQQILQQINQLPSTAEVNKAEQDGINNIATILPNVVVKQEAIDDIQNIANRQKQQNKQTPDATHDEINEANQIIDNTVNENKQRIKQVTTNEEVAQLKNKADDMIDKTKPKVRRRRAALDALDQGVEEQIATINQTPDATDDEKQEAIDKIKALRQQLGQQISQDQTNSQIDNTESKGLEDIKNILPNVHVKKDGRQNINDKAHSQEDEINQVSDATDEEKNAAINVLHDTTSNVLNDINQDNSTQDVQDHVEQGNQAIDKIKPETKVKPEARESLKQTLDELLNDINHNQEATIEEKEAATKVLENIYQQQALTAIDNDHTNQQVADTVLKYKQLLMDNNVKPMKKPAISQEINNEVIRANTIIKNYNKISDKTKNDALQKIAQLKTAMEDDLRIAISNQEADEVLKRFKHQLHDLETIIATQEQSLIKIDIVANQTIAKFKAIATASQLSHIIKQIEDYKAEGFNMIDGNLDLALIKQHTNETITKILSIKLPVESAKEVIMPRKKVTPQPPKVNNNSTPQCSTKVLPKTGGQDYHLPFMEISLVAGLALVARQLTKKQQLNK